jgi:hypothetical protein
VQAGLSTKSMRNIIIILIFTGISSINILTNNYYIVTNTTNQYANRTAPPKTGIPERREVGITESNLEIY